MPKPPVDADRPADGDADEASLLREALKGVAPLPDRRKASTRPPPPPPVPIQAMREDEQVLKDSLSDALPMEAGLETGEELVFLRNGLSNQVLRKLRRGFWATQDHLDLHGARSDEARGLLVEFLNAALRRGLRCVRIVHGKGLRSPGSGPVLKNKVAGWLAQRDEILAFVQARPEDGGGGAVMVLLKARARHPGEARGPQDEDR